MPTPAPEDFWPLVVASRLVAPAALAALRAEYESAVPSSPVGEDATTTIAKWLVMRGAVSRWQARRLLSGERGPFFIGDYRLIERLECDGAGRLFRARHEPSGRTLCLMLLDRQLCQHPDVWQGIVRRTTIASETTDPVLGRTWSLEQEKATGHRFILCEDVEGPPLGDELGRLGPLKPADACRVMLQLARGTAELHRRGVVHGGISLDAIRCEPAAPGGVDAIGVPNGRRVRLLQIPLVGDPHATAPLAAADSTERIARLGRRASFVPPEMMEPGRTADRRGDVYALGCVFHALLTGAPPCWKGDAQRTLSHAALAGPEPLGPPRVPVEIASLVSYMVARDPAGRYADAPEVADAIASCLGLPPVSAELPPQRPPADDPVDTAATVANAPLDAVATPPALPVATPASLAAARQRDGRRRRTLTAVGGAVVATALLAVLAVVLSRRGPAEPSGAAAQAGRVADAPHKRDARAEPGAAAATQPAAAEAADEAAVSPDVRPQTVVESADLPWASPTRGGPPSLAHLPPGSQLILVVRPAEMLDTAEGALFVRALGPAVARGIDALATICGVPLDGIEEILGGWQAGDPGSGQPDVIGGWVVRLEERMASIDDAGARAAAWGLTKEEKLDGETIHHGKAVSFWLPSADEGRVLAIAPAGLIRQMVEAAQAAGTDGEHAPPPDLTPDMEALVDMLDGTRHITLLGSPHYLLHDGRPMLSGGLGRLVEPIGAFLGDGIKAAALSAHFADNLYVELDAIAPRDEPTKKLAKRLAGGVDSWADAVETAIAATPLHDYGKKLVMRLPTMVRVLAANARSGPEGRGVVLNAYLPQHAAHNLVLAAELALEQAAGKPAAAAATAATPSAAAGALAKLQQVISLTFASNNLEAAVQMVSDEIGVPIEILGKDLELHGITKNQAFGLEEREKTADAVLRTILLKSDPSGRLVFVVRAKNGAESLAVTTKSAAANRGDKLPPGFEPVQTTDPAEGKKPK